MYTLITKSKEIPNNFNGVAEYPDGHKAYYVEDKLHRLNGPAIEWADGGKSYYVEGKLHRLDGPALEWADGHKEYWVEGVQLTEKEFLVRIPKSCSKDLSGLTVEIEGKKYLLTEIAK